MVVTPEAALVKLTLWKVSPPPLNVGDAFEQLIVDVPALKVNPVVVVNVIAAAAESVTVEEPKVNVLVVDALELIPVVVTLKFPVSNVPFDKLIAAVDVNALPNVQPPPIPLKVIAVAVSVTPFVVIVFPVDVAEY